MTDFPHTKLKAQPYAIEAGHTPVTNKHRGELRNFYFFLQENFSMMELMENNMEEMLSAEEVVSLVGITRRQIERQF